MGTKRPFDEEFQQFIKHPKHLDYGNKLALLAENQFSYDVSQTTGIPGGEAEGTFHKFHMGEGLENENVNTVADMADKEFKTTAPSSLVNNTSVEEDAGFGAVLCSSFFPDYFEFNFPRRPLVRFDDTYPSVLNCSLRKEVPLGSNQQADVPEFEPQVVKENTVSYDNIVDNGSGENFAGVIVIPMPDLDFSAEVGEAADGGMDCGCVDGGSVRCVQQHVKEARVKLRESLGHVKFMDLGFYDMGEEVALRWTEEEERTFHEVVYSNPVSSGKNFWEHLSKVFPSRTKKELVSYYFNVFILRRRATQNRSKLLEIDSDDDEWRGNDCGPFGVREEDEDFVVGSFIGHDVRVDHGDDSLSDDDNVDGDGDGDEDGDDNGGGDVLIGGADAAENDIGEFGVKEDSCTSFKCQQYVQCCEPDNEKESAIQENRVKSEQGKDLHGNRDEVKDGGLGSEYVSEPCDGKVWDLIGLSKGVDLLPTCTMIEEIFGPSRNGKSIS